MNKKLLMVFIFALLILPQLSAQSMNVLNDSLGFFSTSCDVAPAFSTSGDCLDTGIRTIIMAALICMVGGGDGICDALGYVISAFKSAVGTEITAAIVILILILLSVCYYPHPPFENVVFTTDFSPAKFNLDDYYGYRYHVYVPADGNLKVSNIGKFYMIDHLCFGDSYNHYVWIEIDENKVADNGLKKDKKVICSGALGCIRIFLEGVLQDFNFNTIFQEIWSGSSNEIAYSFTLSEPGRHNLKIKYCGDYNCSRVVTYADYNILIAYWSYDINVSNDKIGFLRGYDKDGDSIENTKTATINLEFINNSMNGLIIKNLDIVRCPFDSCKITTSFPIILHPFVEGSTNTAAKAIVPITITSSAPFNSPHSNYLLIKPIVSDDQNLKTINGIPPKQKSTKTIESLVVKESVKYATIEGTFEVGSSNEDKNLLVYLYNPCYYTEVESRNSDVFQGLRLYSVDQTNNEQKILEITYAEFINQDVDKDKRVLFKNILENKGPKIKYEYSGVLCNLKINDTTIDEIWDQIPEKLRDDLNKDVLNCNNCLADRLVITSTNENTKYVDISLTTEGQSEVFSQDICSGNPACVISSDEGEKLLADLSSEVKDGSSVYISSYVINGSSATGLNTQFVHDSNTFTDIFVKDNTKVYARHRQFTYGEEGEDFNIPLNLLWEWKETYVLKLSTTGEISGCVGKDGTIGKSNVTKPRVKYSWDWQSIDINTCDPSSNPNYVYCDATQFTISLMKRLNAIDLLIKTTNIDENTRMTKIRELQKFEAALMKDAFSEDFFADFNNYMLIREPTTIQPYKNCWSNYIKDRKILYRIIPYGDSFTNPLPYAGIYDINIEIGGPIHSKVPLCGAGYNYIIYVYFIPTKINTNIFYQIPLNGMVGIDATGKLDRDGYGVEYTADSSTDVIIANINNLLIRPIPTSETAKNKGLVKLSVKKIDSYAGTKNGVLMNLKKEAQQNLYTLEFAPSFATPIIGKSGISQNFAGLFYSLLLPNGTEMPAAESLNSWTAFGESINGLSCVDYLGQPLFIEREDTRATTNIECVKYTNCPAYGLSWNGVNRNGSVYVATVFFTPLRSDGFYNFINKGNIGTFYSISPLEAIPQNKVLQLDGARLYQIYTVKDVVDNIGKDEICVTGQTTEKKIFWNYLKLLKDNIGEFLSSSLAAYDNLEVCQVVTRNQQTQ